MCLFFTAGGYYLYLNNTSPPARDNVAMMLSSPVSAFPGLYKCAHFWYHMNGQDKDCCQLKVRVQRADGTMSDAVWEKMGDVRSAWKEAFVNLNMREPFQVRWVYYMWTVQAKITNQDHHNRITGHEVKGGGGGLHRWNDWL